MAKNDFFTQLVGSGRSFSMVVESAHTAFYVSHEPSLVGINETTDRQYVKEFIEINFKRCCTIIMDKKWCTYRTAFDSATNSADAYLDVFIVIHIRKVIHTIHLLAILMRCLHTRIAIFHLASGILESVAGYEWNKKLIAVATDGASNMTGRPQRVVPRLEECAIPGFTCVWCVAHQLDLIT